MSEQWTLRKKDILTIVVGGKEGKGTAPKPKPVPQDRWSREWALAHAKKASKRLLEIEIETYEELLSVAGAQEREHLEILRAELKGR